MSKIDKLLKNEKVEWKKLSEVAAITQGKQFNKRDMSEGGKYPVINGGVLPSGYAHIYNCDENTITVAQGGSAGFVSFIEQKFWLGAHAYSVVPSKIILEKYNYNFNTFNRLLFHTLKNSQYYLESKKVGVGLQSITKDILGNIQIPLVCKNTQEKIVKILDNFTNYVTELQAELQARVKQYEYYRDLLLSEAYLNKLNLEEGGSRIEFKSLKSLLDYLQPTKYIVESSDYNPNYKTPVLTAGKSFILGYTNDETNIYPADSNHPVIIFDDFTASNHWVDFNFKVKSSALKILTAKPGVNLKYCYYFINTLKIDITEHRRLWISELSNIKIPLPSKEIQAKIVEILDKLNLMQTETKGLLPKEIKQRQQQYKYYRTELFAFDTMGG